MSPQVFVDEFETPKHAKEHKALQEIALSLHQANVSLILTGATEASEERKVLIRVASTHLFSGVNTLVSILALTEKLSLKIKEAIALARVLYETFLVAAFTCVGGAERARRAELYSIYKTFRNQTQLRKTGKYELRVSRTHRLSRKNPQVVDALKMFGGRSSIRPCFTENRDDMIRQVAEKDAIAGLLFDGVEGMIHDVSSEIIHGSFHGYALFDSLHNGRSDHTENLGAHHEMVFFSVTLSVAALSRTLSKTLGMKDSMRDLERSCIASFMPYISDDMAAKLRTIYAD